MTNDVNAGQTCPQKDAKDRLAIIILAVSLCGMIKTIFFIIVVGFILFFPFGKAHYDEADYGSFTPEDSYSYDGRFVAHQRMERFGSDTTSDS